jgi:hypothetical protein
MTFAHLFCRLTGHLRDGHRVWHDQLDFRSHCRRCGVAMVRDMQGWRVFDPDQDADPRRIRRED